MSDKTILIVGTYDTKDDELNYLADQIQAQGGKTLSMDVSVLGDPSLSTDFSKHQVAKEGGHSIQSAIDTGDENKAMQIMAKGASLLALRLVREGKADGVIILGGTMGTDLALDVCCALPLGVPKYIVSTVSFSPLMPPERIPADVQMILWAGGLYGLNSVCKSSLSQAAGAVLGAARAVEAPKWDRPMIGMTSFGKTILHYMVKLKPELEKRGFEVAVFHATGMGGRAFESLASQGAFACVMDFATQEVGNHMFGGLSAGADRLTNAGKQGTSQMVAPACYDLCDLVGHQPLPAEFEGVTTHDHNRLVKVVLLDTEQRRAVARAHGEKLAKAKGPTHVFLPVGGLNEWDRPGGDLHDAEGLAAFCEAFAKAMPDNVKFEAMECHINDDPFSQRVLALFDEWIANGIVRKD